MPSDVHIEQQQSLSQFRHLSSPPSPSSSSSSSTTTTTSVKERRSMSEQTDINISGCTMIDGQPESIYMQRYKALRDAGFDETTANKYSPLYSSVNEVIDAILSQSLNDNLTTNGGRTIMAKKGIDNNSYSTAIYCNGNNKSSTIMNYNDTSAINAAELLSELTDSISMNKTNNNNNNNLIMECIHGQSPSSTSSKSFLYMSNGDSNGSVINSNDLISCSSNESFHNHSHINADGNYLSLSNCIGNSHRNSLMKNTIFSSESSESSTDNNRSNSSNLIVTMLKDGLLEDSSDEITLEDDVGLLADGQNGNGSSSSPSTSSSLSSGISSSFFMDTSSSSPSSFSSLSSSISISPPSNQSIVANFEQQQQRQSTNNNNGNHHQTLTNDNGTLISLFLSKQQQQKSSNNNNNVQNNGKIKSTSAKTITTMMMNDSNDIIISNGYNNNNNNRMHNGINKNNNNNETNDLNCETFSFSLDNLSTSSSSSTSSSLSSNTTTMESNQQKNGEQTFDGLLENHHHSMIIGNNKLSFNSNNRLSMKLYGNGNDSAENSHHHHHHHYQQNNNNKLLHPVNGNNSDSVPVVEPNSFNDTGHISGVDGGHHYRHNLHFPSTTMIDKFNVDSGCTDLLFDNHDQQNPKTTNGLMMKSCQPITVAAGYRNSDDTLNDLLGYLNLQQQLFTNNQPQQQQQQQHLQYGNNFDHRNCSMLATVTTPTSSSPSSSSLSSNSLSTTNNNNNDVISSSSQSSSFDENGVNLKNTVSDIFNNVENNTATTIVGVLNEINNHYHHHQNNNCNNKNNYNNNNNSNNLNLFSSSTPSSSPPVSINTTSTSLLIDTLNTMNDSIFNQACSSESVTNLEQHHQLNQNCSPNNYHQHHHHHHQHHSQQQYHTFLTTAPNHHANHQQQQQQPRTFADIAASSLNGHHSNGVHNNNGNNVLNSSGSGSNNIDLVDSSSFLSILDSPTHKSLNCSNNGNNGTSNGYFNAFTSSSNIPVANTIQSFYDQFNTEQNGLNKKFYRKQQQTQALNFRPIGASPLSPSMNVNDANKLLKSGQIKESQLGFIRSSNGSLTITDCGGHIGIGDNGFESNGITMNENNTQSPNRPTNLMGYKGLWVCNVSPEVGLHYLKRRFRRYGHFTGIQTFERRATNGTNIVFVHYDNPNSPVEAIAALHNYNGQDLCADPNEPLKLRFAPSMEQSRAGQLPTLEQARKIVEKSGECFNWRLSSGCHRGQRCHLKHVSINKEIDSQPWVKALKKKINET
ncbi:CCR4-NOT transcription complex subunit 1 [Dermatophagoides farinae]|uniref:CCR4-NOT transcription complex subunit 1 n=1 Tax=Dermatophagoides farinae TaxID=6954 RepID=A0A922IDP2_DERFA|nr:CCR4-NOT transcription complex subunit 1 [Dermatophagoides farinae]